MIDMDHAMHVSRLSRDIGGRMGMDDKQCAILSVAGMFHDLGKLGLPHDLLDKPSTLTPDEYKVIQWHTTLGHLMLSGMPDEIHRAAAEAALYHHERCDGSGYMGLSKEKIPISARIVAVCDVYDALVSHRPYRKAWSKEAALEHMRLHSGSLFDTDVVNALLEILKEV